MINIIVTRRSVDIIDLHFEVLPDISNLEYSFTVVTRCYDYLDYDYMDQMSAKSSPGHFSPASTVPGKDLCGIGRKYTNCHTLT